MNAPGQASRQRILVVIRQFFPRAAGAETQALRQAKSYIAMGHPTTVVTGRYDRALPKLDSIEGVGVVRLAAPQVRFLGSLVFLTSLALYLILRARQYDAVLVFHLKQAAMIAAVVCGLLGKRAVISDQAAGQFGDIHALKTALMGGLILAGCRRAAAFISGSRDITDELLSARIPASRIRFIPNGVPMERFASLPDRAGVRIALGLPDRAFVVVNIGRQTAQKDLQTLLAAWREFVAMRPQALLCLVGDGDERRRLETLVSQWRLADTVRFEGWRQNVSDYLAAADVFASSSVSEGTHLALGEAMAAGLPVIATPVGGARDFVRDGDNGIIVPVGDAGRLSDALERLASDGALRERMGKAGAAAVRRLLDQDETARRHLEVLFGSLRRHRPRTRFRIAHLIATLDRGGSEGQMAQLATRLDSRRFGMEVLCLTRGGPTAATLDAASVPYRVIGKKGKFDLSGLLWLARRFFLDPPDVLHTWLFTSNAYGRFAALMAGIDNVVVAERSTDPWKPVAYRALDNLLAAGTKCIVANGRAVAQSLAGRGIPASKIAVIPNGVDLERFHPMDPDDARFILALPAGVPAFGFMGRLAFEKRPDVFIQVARAVVAEVPRARAIIFGEGPMEEALKAEARRLKEYLTFFGDSQFPELCHSALNCLVLTSKWEGFPNVILEAMACGRPVVAVRMPATEEIIEHGRTGLLVEDSIPAIASAVIGILKDPDKAAEMGRRGRERVEKLFSLDKMLRAHEDLYLRILNRPPSNEESA